MERGYCKSCRNFENMVDKYGTDKDYSEGYFCGNCGTPFLEPSEDTSSYKDDEERERFSESERGLREDRYYG